TTRALIDLRLPVLFFGPTRPARTSPLRNHLLIKPFACRTRVCRPAIKPLARRDQRSSRRGLDKPPFPINSPPRRLNHNHMPRIRRHPLSPHISSEVNAYHNPIHVRRGTLRSEVSKIVQRLRRVQTMSGRLLRIHHDAIEHRRPFNKMNLSKLTLRRARTYPPRSRQLDSLNKRLVGTE